MTGALFNALCLAAAALLVTCFLHRRLASRNIRREPPGPPEGTDARDFLRARYAARTRFRAGVLLFSLAALLVYLGGGGRGIPILLLCGAGLCQYGASRRSTAAYLTQAMQQRFFEGEERENAAPSDAASGRMPENGLTHATTRR